MVQHTPDGVRRAGGCPPPARPVRRRHRAFVGPLAVALAALVGTACGPDGAPDDRDGAARNRAASGAGPLAAARLDVPADLAPDWLPARATAQAAAVRRAGVFAGFRLRDTQPESGLAFTSRVTDDSAKTFKSVHYDHGSAVALADVDGDALPDAYFVRQVGPNALWRNAGGGRFEDVTAAAGVAVPDAIGVGASFGDLDNDGDADLVATTVRAGTRLFANDGRGGFADVTGSSGLAADAAGHGSGIVLFDYDRDGRLDLFVSMVGAYTTDVVRTASRGVDGLALGPGELAFFDGRPDAFSGHLFPERAERSRLFRNLGDLRFADVTADVGLVADGWSGDAVVLDGNDDGWPDLYVLDMQGDDDYFENDGGQRFVDRSRAVFPRTPWGSMGAKVFDADGDGRLDLLITDMHSDMSELVGPFDEKRKADMQWPESMLRTNGASIFGNALFRRQPDGAFVDDSDAAGVETYWPWGPSVGDLNADGAPDIFVTAGMGYPFRYAANSLLLAAGGAFVDAETVVGVEPRRDGVHAAPSFDLDCDAADRGHGDCHGRTGRHTVWAALSSRSSAIADLDADGDLDVLTNENDGPPLVLVSDLAAVAPARRLLVVRLVGRASNRDGLGARVAVTAGGRTQVAAHDGKSGYLAQSALPLSFGLGEADVVERVAITWPSGVEQRIDGPIDAAAPLVVTEPAAP